VNVRNMKPRVETGPGVSEDDFLLLCDAQTSGGLLVALPAASAEAYAAKCREDGASSTAVVGRVVEAGGRRVPGTKKKRGGQRGEKSDGTERGGGGCPRARGEGARR